MVVPQGVSGCQPRAVPVPDPAALAQAERSRAGQREVSVPSLPARGAAAVHITQPLLRYCTAMHAASGSGEQDDVSAVFLAGLRHVWWNSQGVGLGGMGMGAGSAGCWLRRQQGLGLLWLGFGSRSLGRGQLLVGHGVCGTPHPADPVGCWGCWLSLQGAAARPLGCCQGSGQCGWESCACSRT